MFEEICTLKMSRKEAFFKEMHVKFVVVAKHKNARVILREQDILSERVCCITSATLAFPRVEKMGGCTSITHL